MNQEVEFDEYDVDKLKNKAHQIIYKSIVEKLQELKKRRKEHTDESERLYLAEYEKYRDELSQEDAGDASTNIDELLGGL
jgi:hypothetical protein